MCAMCGDDDNDNKQLTWLLTTDVGCRPVLVFESIAGWMGGDKLLL